LELSADHLAEVEACLASEGQFVDAFGFR
jgi:hypothetical protein